MPVADPSLPLRAQRSSGNDVQQPRQGSAGRVGVIVTVFPAITETFIMRDVVGLQELGYEVRLYHLTHFNRREVVHDFARGVLPHARDFAYLASLDVLQANASALGHHPLQIARIVGEIMAGCRLDPVMLLKSLFILPKSVRIAADLKVWGADHVHAAYAGHPATGAWIVQRLTGIPYSASSHAHDIFETRALLDVKLREAEFVRTISKFNQNYLLHHFPALADRPPVVIHVGGLLDKIPALAPPPTTGTFRVLYVGSLETRKGVDVLLRALAEAQLGEWRLEVIGKGPERELLEKQSAQLGLAGAVSFRGGLSFEEVSRAMAAASVMVVPSRIGPRNQTEGLPTVIVEALAHQRPVIASRLTGIPEIVRHGETGLLVEVDDVSGFARALEEVRRDPEAAYRRAVRGRALVEAEFDQAQNIRALAALLDDSIKSFRRKRG